jgi:uncharacterized DUF497 family protein
MRLEWDESKNRSNLRHHGIDFAAVEREKIFSGETITRLDDRFEYGESRFLTLGLLKGDVVSIIHTETDDVVRIISVRKASKNEENIYFREVKN